MLKKINICDKMIKQTYYERVMIMKITKKIVSLLLALTMLFAVSVTAFAAESDGNEAPDIIGELAGAVDGLLGSASDVADSATGVVGDIVDTLTSSDKKQLTPEKASNVAMTAAKAKYAIEGISSDITKDAVVTKVKYDKSNGAYYIVIRADYIYKYECKVTVTSILGNELGVPEDSIFTEQGKVAGFCGQIFEQICYFFIRLVGMDAPKA